MSFEELWKEVEADADKLLEDEKVETKALVKPEDRYGVLESLAWAMPRKENLIPLCAGAFIAGFTRTFGILLCIGAWYVGAVLGDVVRRVKFESKQLCEKCKKQPCECYLYTNSLGPEGHVPSKKDVPKGYHLDRRPPPPAPMPRSNIRRPETLPPGPRPRFILD